jgi:hypothetical protein
VQRTRRLRSLLHSHMAMTRIFFPSHPREPEPRLIGAPGTILLLSIIGTTAR